MTKYNRAVTRTGRRMHGFKPLKNHCIHLRCPRCGRKQSNVSRECLDPDAAVLVETLCPKCSQGTKDPGMEYYRANGTTIKAFIG
jgi:hypothetical protein